MKSCRVPARADNLSARECVRSIVQFIFRVSADDKPFTGALSGVLPGIWNGTVGREQVRSTKPRWQRLPPLSFYL